MAKFVIVSALILLGLFVVYVINNNVTPKPAQVKDQSLNLASLSPTPSQSFSPSLSPAPSLKISQAENISKEMTAVIRTGRGDIAVSFYPQDAPNTVANFMQKVQSGFYTGKIFHRVEDWVIQGGDPDGDGTGGGNMPVEFNNKPFVVGSLGIASRGDGKVQNDSQFFITKQDASWLNGQYTNFGIVTSGIDVVDKIQIGDKILGITIE